MCRTMVDIQSAIAKITRGKKIERKIERMIERNHRAKIQWPALHRAATVSRV